MGPKRKDQLFPRIITLACFPSWELTNNIFLRSNDKYSQNYTPKIAIHNDMKLMNS